MKKTALRGVFAACSLFLAVTGLQPAHAAGASSLTGHASGGYNFLPPLPTGTTPVHFGGKFAGVTVTSNSGTSAGVVDCNFIGTSIGSAVIETGIASGQCNQFFVVGDITITCTGQWTRAGVEELLTISCTFVLPSGTTTGSGQGFFQWTPTGFSTSPPGVTAFVLDGNFSQTLV
jgi:hypothetical protein